MINKQTRAVICGVVLLIVTLTYWNHTVHHLTEDTNSVVHLPVFNDEERQQTIAVTPAPPTPAPPTPAPPTPAPPLSAFDQAAVWLMERLKSGAYNAAHDASELQRLMGRPVAMSRAPFGRNPSLQEVHDKVKANYLSFKEGRNDVNQRIPLLGLMCTPSDCNMQLNLIVTLDVPVEGYVMVINGDAPLSKLLAAALSLEFPGFVFAHPHDGNEGVSRGWNLALRQAFVRSDPPKPSCFIANSDIEFRPHTLGPAIRSFITSSDMLVARYHDFAFFSMKREAFEKLGYADETLYPGYGEDVDFHLRMVALGIGSNQYLGNFNLHSHHYVSPNLKHNPGVNGMFHRGAHCLYIEVKWGVKCGQFADFQFAKPYRHPFNRESISIVNSWTPDPQYRKCIVEGLSSVCRFNVDVVKSIENKPRRDDF